MSLKEGDRVATLTGYGREGVIEKVYAHDPWRGPGHRWATVRFDDGSKCSFGLQWLQSAPTRRGVTVGMTLDEHDIDFLDEMWEAWCEANPYVEMKTSVVWRDRVAAARSRLIKKKRRLGV